MESSSEELNSSVEFVVTAFNLRSGRRRTTKEFPKER